MNKVIARTAVALAAAVVLLLMSWSPAFASEVGVSGQAPVPPSSLETPTSSAGVPVVAVESKAAVGVVSASPSTSSVVAAVAPLAASGSSPVSVKAAVVSAATALPVIVVDPQLGAPQPQPASSGATGRVGSGFAGTPDGTAAVLYGGGDVFSGGPASGDTWVWDGATWTAKCGTTFAGATAPCAPGPRDLVGEATGPTGVVLYGGQTSDGMGNTTLHADSYRWDGNAWQQICSTCAPGARAAAAMAGNGSIVLLFGGGDTGGGPAAPFGDTWQFDGASWTQVNPGGVGQPAGRIGGSMAWDGQHFVLFGGLIQDATSQTSLDDTWVWTGSSWAQACGAPLGACGPTPRVLGGFANLASIDPAQRGALLVGGLALSGNSSAPSVLGDVWFWNGQRWAQQASPWPDSTSLDGGFPVGVPFVGALGALRASCRVTLAADRVTNDGSGPLVSAGTWNLGFDTNHDGQPGPCPPEPLPVRTVATPASIAASPTSRAQTNAGMPTTGSDLLRDATAGAGFAFVGVALTVGSRRRCWGRRSIENS